MGLSRYLDYSFKLNQRIVSTKIVETQCKQDDDLVQGGEELDYHWKLNPVIGLESAPDDKLLLAHLKPIHLATEINIDEAVRYSNEFSAFQKYWFVNLQSLWWGWSMLRHPTYYTLKKRSTRKTLEQPYLLTQSIPNSTSFKLIPLFSVTPTFVCYSCDVGYNGINGRFAWVILMVWKMTPLIAANHEGVTTIDACYTSSG